MTLLDCSSGHSDTGNRQVRDPPGRTSESGQRTSRFTHFVSLYYADRKLEHVTPTAVVATTKPPDIRSMTGRRGGVVIDN